MIDIRDVTVRAGDKRSLDRVSLQGQGALYECAKRALSSAVCI
ncbi:hypothetical protein [Paracoccus sp. (in: a-proteobacteria)]